MTQAFVNWFVNMSASLVWFSGQTTWLWFLRFAALPCLWPLWRQHQAVRVPSSVCKTLEISFPQTQGPTVMPSQAESHFIQANIESSKMIKWHGRTMQNYVEQLVCRELPSRQLRSRPQSQAPPRIRPVCEDFMPEFVGCFGCFCVIFCHFSLCPLKCLKMLRLSSFLHTSRLHNHTSLASWLAWAWVTRLLQRWHLSELHLCVVSFFSFVLCFFRYVHQVLQSWKLARHSSDNPVLLVQQSSDLVERGRAIHCWPSFPPLIVDPQSLHECHRCQLSWGLLPWQGAGGFRDLRIWFTWTKVLTFRTPVAYPIFTFRWLAVHALVVGLPGARKDECSFQTVL